MILYNNNDQQITLPGVRVGSTLIAGASIRCTLINKVTNASVFSVAMSDDVGNVGNYVLQPPLFDVAVGSNYQISFSGLVQTYELTLLQDVEIQNRTR